MASNRIFHDRSRQVRKPLHVEALPCYNGTSARVLFPD